MDGSNAISEKRQTAEANTERLSRKEVLDSWAHST